MWLRLFARRMIADRDGSMPGLGMALETMKQIHRRLMMRSYERFLE